MGREDALAAAWETYTKTQATCATFTDINLYDPGATTKDFFKCTTFLAQPPRTLRDAFFFYCINNRSGLNHQPFPGWHRGEATVAVTTTSNDPLINSSQKSRKQIWYCSPEGMFLKSRQDVQAYMFEVGDTVYGWDVSELTNEPTIAPASNEVDIEVKPTTASGATTTTAPASSEAVISALDRQEKEANTPAGAPPAAKIPIISFSPTRRITEKDFSFVRSKSEIVALDTPGMSEDEWNKTTESLETTCVRVVWGEGGLGD